jgi:hypothetical protein
MPGVPNPCRMPLGMGLPRCGQGGLRLMQVGDSRALRRGPIFARAYFYGRVGISGVSRDSTNAAIGNCTLRLFRTGTDEKIAQTVSDGAGNFTFSFGTNAGYFYIVAENSDGSLAGVTLDTLVATQLP